MPWAFRGHADDTWGLLPSAWRPANQTIEAARADATERISRFTGQHTLNWIYPNQASVPIVFDPTTEQQLARRLVIEATAELLLLYDFAQTCDTHGINTPLLNIFDPHVDLNYLHMPAHPLIADEIFRDQICPRLSRWHSTMDCLLGYWTGP